MLVIELEDELGRGTSYSLESGKEARYRRSQRNDTRVLHESDLGCNSTSVVIEVESLNFECSLPPCWWVQLIAWSTSRHDAPVGGMTHQCP